MHNQKPTFGETVFVSQAKAGHKNKPVRFDQRLSGSFGWIPRPVFLRLSTRTRPPTEAAKTLFWLVKISCPWRANIPRVEIGPRQRHGEYCKYQNNPGNNDSGFRWHGY